MISGLFILSILKKPVVVIPPLYGSNLFVSYESNTNLHFYCPKSQKTELLWFDSKYLVPPVFNCLFQLLTLHWNDENQKIQSLPNVTIDVQNFGGEESIKYVDKEGIFGYHFIESYASLFQAFKDRDYIVGKNIFGAPYDWRLAIAGLGEYWNNLKDLIERASAMNNQPVVLFGFSTGGYILQQFLANKVTQEWKDKFVDRVVFLAPSFGGAGLTLSGMWDKYFPVLPFLKSSDLSTMIESMAVIMQHFPNHVVWKDIPIVRGPYDETYNASQIRDLFVKYQKIRGDNIKILDECQKISKERPEGPGRPTYIIYNSGVRTDFGLYFKNGWEKPPLLVGVDGDGTVMARGPQYACSNWPADKHPLHCQDLYINNERFEHQPLASNPYVHDLVLDIVEGNWVNESGRHAIRGPFVEVDGSNYTIKSDLRPSVPIEIHI